MRADVTAPASHDPADSSRHRSTDRNKNRAEEVACDLLGGTIVELGRVRRVWLDRLSHPPWLRPCSLAAPATASPAPRALAGPGVLAGRLHLLRRRRHQPRPSRPRTCPRPSRRRPPTRHCAARSPSARRPGPTRRDAPPGAHALGRPACATRRRPARRQRSRSGPRRLAAHALVAAHEVPEYRRSIGRQRQPLS